MRVLSIGLLSAAAAAALALSSGTALASAACQDGEIVIKFSHVVGEIASLLPRRTRIIDCSHLVQFVQKLRDVIVQGALRGLRISVCHVVRGCRILAHGSRGLQRPWGGAVGLAGNGHQFVRKDIFQQTA